MAVLHPTPELWTAGALQHRTQIIYTTDISVITLQLELRPGCIVVESGTGSGSLSQAIARTIAPSGHLYTFEFHEQRASIARDLFRDCGLEKIITVGCRDACEQGYTLKDAEADAVMLDLPCPWLAIPHAARVLKHYGTICNFSPCIEQVQRAAEALSANGFKGAHLMSFCTLGSPVADVRTVECLIRPFEVRATSFKPLPTAAGAAPGKRAREEPEKAEKEDDDEEAGDDDDTDEKKDREPAQQPQEQLDEAVTRQERSARPLLAIRGHTSYLTFARRIRDEPK